MIRVVFRADGVHGGSCSGLATSGRTSVDQGDVVPPLLPHQEICSPYRRRDFN